MCLKTSTTHRRTILCSAMVLLVVVLAFAGVGGSDVPTVPASVFVGQTGVPFSFTVSNASTTPNNVDTVQVLDGFIFFTTTCGSSLTPGLPCPGGAAEAPSTIEISPLTAVGEAGTACAGISFTVAATANPNEYSFSPANPVILGPSSVGGSGATCKVNFTVNVNALPVHDSSGSAGLQTSQLARVDDGGLVDTTTQEHGSATGSSTLSVVQPCLHLEKQCSDATACDGPIGVSVAATNCGTETLNSLSVTDDQAGALTCGATTLAAGASTTCTGSYSATPGTYTDHITDASAVGAVSHQTVSPNATSILSDTCVIPPPPSVTVVKTCEDNSLACDATEATFKIHVCNDGTADWSGTITDADCGITDQAISLTAGNCTDIPCTISGGAPSITNGGGSVSVTANGCHDSATINSASCPVPPAPSVTASKTCTSPDLACTATQATFNIHVCNDGTANWSGTITDADCGITDQAISLTAGNCTDIACTVSGGAPSITNRGGSVSVTANGCNDTATIPSASCNVLGCPCQVQITKQVAPDDGSSGGTACDGVADAPFVESVTVQPTDCVVYQICVTNSCTDSDCQTLDTTGVTVSDDHLGIVSFDFGTITPGQTVCKLVPSEITTATQCPGGTCVCQNVEGINTAVVSSAICEITKTNACLEAGSDCDDTANVNCISPVGCRMTGGHNNLTTDVDAAYEGNGKSYTTGGQIGAPTNVGCCSEPPTSRGHDSECPWGEWEHNHHFGPDDTDSVTEGSFAFHSGTASAPDEAFIQDIICADPGWCVQARPAPVKQIFWEGIGVFHNTTTGQGKNVVIEPLPYFAACGVDQPVPWSKKATGYTLHYYRAHVGDFGEPAGQNQKPSDDGTCFWANTCEVEGAPAGGISISACELVDGYCPFTPAPTDEKFTALHPLCEAQDCGCESAGDPSCQTNKVGCPDWYEIEIHCTTDPTSPIAYKVAHFINQGNFQLHPAVGSSCQPCGDGMCQPEFDETCATCPQDCGTCPH